MENGHNITPYLMRVWRGLTKKQLSAGLSMCVCVHVCVRARVLAQSCPTLCDPMDCSLPGSSVHGIFQARIL